MEEIYNLVGFGFVWLFIVVIGILCVGLIGLIMVFIYYQCLKPFYELYHAYRGRYDNLKLTNWTINHYQNHWNWPKRKTLKVVQKRQSKNKQEE